MMKSEDLKEKAKELGVKPGKLKKEELIRSIQLAEGNIDCFKSGNAPICGQDSCLWREEC